MLHFIKGACDVFIKFCNIPVPFGFGFNVTVGNIFIFCLVVVVIYKIVRSLFE